MAAIRFAGLQTCLCTHAHMHKHTHTRTNTQTTHTYTHAARRPSASVGSGGALSPTYRGPSSLEAPLLADEGGIKERQEGGNYSSNSNGDAGGALGGACSAVDALKLLGQRLEAPETSAQVVRHSFHISYQLVPASAEL